MYIKPPCSLHACMSQHIAVAVINTRETGIFAEYYVTFGELANWLNLVSTGKL